MKMRKKTVSFFLACTLILGTAYPVGAEPVDEENYVTAESQAASPEFRISPADEKGRYYGVEMHIYTMNED